MSMNSVVWFEIYVQDMPRAKAFYEGVLGVKLEPLSTPADGIAEMWAFPGKPENAGATGALVKMANGPSGMGGVLIYFASEDCAVECARVPDHGGTITKPKFSIGAYGNIAIVADTEGNMIGFHSMK
jgi:uncharacterized protein